MTLKLLESWIHNCWVIRSVFLAMIIWLSKGYILPLCLCFQFCRSDHFLYSRSQDLGLITRSYACDLQDSSCRDIARYYRDIAEFWHIDIAEIWQRYFRQFLHRHCRDMQRACRDFSEFFCRNIAESLQSLLQKHLNSFCWDSAEILQWYCKEFAERLEISFRRFLKRYCREFAESLQT